MSVTVDPDLGLDAATDAVARATAAGAHHAAVTHAYREQFEVNFDTDDVTLVRTTVDEQLGLTVYVGTKKGSTTITGRDHDAVEAGVSDALAAARAGVDDPANVIPTDPADPAPERGATEPDRDAMVGAALRHVQRMRDEWPTLRTDRSHYSFGCTWSAYANSSGRTQRARRGVYRLSLVVTGRDVARSATTSFNYIDQVGLQPFPELADLPIVDRLLRDTAASFDARPVPGTFVGDVIVTPQAMGTVLGTVVGALAGGSLFRKTTPYLDALGHQIAPPILSVLHRPGELAGSSSFDGHGFANRDLDIIRDGRLDNFLVDWYFANKLGRPMTSASADLVVPEGATSLDEIIGGTERGILLGRYSGGQPNTALDFSGVAKNSFYVEDGKVKHPITETMVAGNFKSLLESITAVSSESIDFGSARFPWVAAGGVTISTK